MAPGLVIVMYFAQQFNKTKSQTDLDYSQFVSPVQAGNVEAVTIHSEDRLITGTTKDDTEFKVVVPDDPNATS